MSHKTKSPIQNLLSTPRSIVLLAVAFAGAILLLSNAVHLPSGEVDFNTQVKPVFNKHCIHCHGGVRQKSGFSLMTRADALSPTESGAPAVVPGHPGESELMRRLLSDDPDVRMPYEAEPLPGKDIRVLRRWIRQGAPWGKHWAYQPVEDVEVPKPEARLWGLLPAKPIARVNNDIDYFIYDALRERDLEPSPEAEKATLLRRVSLDLIGLPPPDHLAASFLSDDTPGAYERLVDSLLQSPRFGEHWASVWLDIARYTDSKGFEKDKSRPMWRYRDWVIRAFNRDMPYDQFLAEQIAGDLLPSPTDAQYVATGFHRNTSTNDEGGTNNEEFRVAAVIDRVNTTWEGLMGTSFACTQCHGHPFDPFRHEEYYEFMAFFNNTRDEDTAEDYPWLRHFEASDSLQLLQLRQWVAHNAGEERARDIYTFVKTWQPSIYSIATDSFVNAELYDTKYLTFRKNSSCRLPDVDLTGSTQLIYRYGSFRDHGVWTIRLDSLGGPVLARVNMSKSKPGWSFGTVDLPEVEGAHDLFMTYENPALPDLRTPGLHFDWFAFTQPFPGEGLPGYAENRDRFWRLMEAKAEHSFIFMENPPEQRRETHVFERGNWLVRGEEVSPGVPGILPPFPPEAPRNRLGLAQWITDERNPLTARTMVNRLWEQLFGKGLVETLEDLGTQGQPPTHPKLLDWLAGRFVHHHDWSVKAMLKEMVLSATYRQDSRVDPEKQEKDPYNRYYARAPRVRLSAEQVRDQALAVSGLLSSKMFGPSVMPPQPEGIWSTPYNNEQWQVSEGEDRHRRAVYTFWKRSAPYPSFQTFDAPDRLVCSARRINTNTPLQALVTLNDPVYLEAAQHLARRMREQGEAGDAGSQITAGYRLAMLKAPPEEKLAALLGLYEEAVRNFTEKPERGEALLASWEDDENARMAALIVIANALLNLDEFLTKS
jgi:hypothetical protein